MPFCPNCGKELEQDAKFCGNCGYQLIKDQGKDQGNVSSPRPVTPSVPVTPVRSPESAPFGADVKSSLTKGVEIISSKPMVLVPALIGGIISVVLSTIALAFFYPAVIFSFYNPAYIGLFAVGAILSLIGGIISYILSFASLDMARDAYEGKPLNLGESFSYVIKRIGIFIIASIVGAILAITIILIPIVALMFVIMVVDETGIRTSISRAFSVIRAKLVDMVLLLGIEIVGSYILGLVPFLGTILVAGFNVLMLLAFIDVYTHFKATNNL